MPDPVEIRKGLSRFRVDEYGITIRSLLRTRSYEWSRIGGLGSGEYRPAGVLLVALSRLPMWFPARNVLHVCIVGDRWTKEVPCVTYDPRSADESRNRDLLRSVIGGWIDRVPVVAPEVLSIDSWWSARPESDPHPDPVGPTTAERAAAIRRELDNLNRKLPPKQT